MSPSANLDFWSDLSGLGRSDAGSVDACATLLKVNAEMFVAAPARDRESIETFEALALGFLPKADHGTLREIARILAACEDTPASVLDYLLRHSTETRGIVLRHAARLTAPAHVRMLATPQGRLALAARADLDPASFENLLALGESAVEDALAANLHLSPEAPRFEILVQRAGERLSLAQLLLSRKDLGIVHEASLYAMAERERRLSIRARVAEVAARQKAPLTFKLSENDVAEFLAAARKSDVRRFEGLLTGALGFPATTDWRLLRIGRHVLLALALKALGFSERDALRIFLTLHPALAYPLSAIRALMREMREVEGPVALHLVEAIIGAKALSADTRMI